MRIHGVVIVASLMTCIVGLASASSRSSRTPECPDNFAYGYDCTEQNALTNCTAQMHSVYGPDCNVLCAHCSSLGNYNCSTSVAQCAN